MNTKDLVTGERLFCLFKGEPKSGKDVAAHSFPETYTFDLEYRIDSVKEFYPSRDFEYDQFNSWFKLQDKIEELKFKCPYKTIIFSGITRCSSLLMSTMIATRAPSKKEQEEKYKMSLAMAASKNLGVKDDTPKRGGIQKAEIDDYSGEFNGLVYILDSLQAISMMKKCHVIVIAHVLTVEQPQLSKDTIITRRLVTSGNKIAPIIPTYFNEAYHFYVEPSFDASKGPEYKLYTKNVGIDWAATIYRNLPLAIDFTNKSLYDILMKYIQKKDGGL